jgi:hypothetical protein
LASAPASASPQAPSPPAARDLLPEAALPSPEKQQAARKINAAFRQLQTDFAALQREGKNREDPDVPTDNEVEALKKLYASYGQIVKQLQQNFDPQAARQFEKIFLGMMIDSRDWRMATWHCSMLEDWESAIYCARQVDSKEESAVMVAFCSGGRLFTKVRKLLHRP